MCWGKTFLYKCFDAGTLQTAQADNEHENELNMSEDLSNPDLGYDSSEEDSSDDRNQLEG